MLLSLVLSVFLGRVLGPGGLGTINLANQIITIIVMLILFGFPMVLVKEVAISANIGDKQRIHNLIGSALMVCISMALIVLFFSFWFGDVVIEYFFTEELFFPLIVLMTVVIFQVISRILASGLNGYNKIWQSALVSESLSLFITLISLLIYYFIGKLVNVRVVAIAFALGRVLVTIFTWLVWLQAHHFTGRRTKFEYKLLFNTGLPLLAAQAANIIATSVDSIMIGALLTTEDVGIYSIAFRVAFVSSFFLQVTNLVLAPRIASFYSKKRIGELQMVIQKTTGYMFVLALLGLLFVLFFGESILKIWGSEFEISYFPLIILSVGQFFNIVTGCVGLLLTLCGGERIWGLMTLIAAILNLILNVLLIPVWGIDGAAVATSSTMILMNVGGVFLVKKYIGVLTIPKIIFEN